MLIYYVCTHIAMSCFLMNKTCLVTLTHLLAMLDLPHLMFQTLFFCSTPTHSIQIGESLPYVYYLSTWYGTKTCILECLGLKQQS